MTRWRTLDGRPTRIIAHRGASGLFPEHSRPAYERAVVDGADVLEPDLVTSADGVLFSRHDAWLSRSTDVAFRSEFADRREAGVDGRVDWWCDRFSAAELRSLHAVQSNPQRDRTHDGRHPLLDFDEVLDIAAAAGLPVYPELKHPRWFGERGNDVAERLIEVLRRRGLVGPAAPVWVQSFEVEALASVRAALDVPVFPLLRFESSGPCEALRRVREATRDFAAGIAVNKRLLFMADAVSWIDDVHAEGAQVHAWTFRDDAIAPEFADPVGELFHAFSLGVDALFCDFPATGVRARAAFAHDMTIGA
ncbi:MAG TPA: glycerophosphodiester phosphodiesterase family protein [Xanthomonadaceae bacterium]|nr:glycerophosphodiester phosphodiesterase family protein [Xanthomonadaceae bacterium]